MSHGRERDIACILYNVHLSIVHLSIIKGNSDQYAIALANKISTKDDIGKSYSSRVKSCISFDGRTGVRTIFTNLTNTLCMLLQAGISFITSFKYLNFKLLSDYNEELTLILPFLWRTLSGIILKRAFTHIYYRKCFSFFVPYPCIIVLFHNLRRLKSSWHYETQCMSTILWYFRTSALCV